MMGFRSVICGSKADRDKDAPSRNMEENYGANTGI
jgi:hypothetical protein